MHPPIPHFLGASSIRIGRTFGIQDTISIRVFCLFISIATLSIIYFLGERFRQGLGLISFAAASWNLLMLMTVWGMHVKLVMLFFYTYMLWALVSKYWFWTGFFLGLAIFSWSGAIVFLALVFTVWLLSGNQFGKTGLSLLIGFTTVAILVSLALLCSGGLISFFDQYALPLQEYVINKFTRQGIRDPEMGLSNIFESSNFSKPDLSILILGLVSLLVFVYQKRSFVFKNTSALTIITSGLLGCATVLIDYQSPFDLLPLLPSLAVLFAWIAERSIDWWLRIWKVDYSVVYPVLMVILLSLVRFTAFREIPERLSAQNRAAAWLAESISGQYSIQAIGDLSILVLNQQRNTLPIIHAGPKTFLSMGNVGWSVERVLDEIKTRCPGLIIIDVRNTRKVYMNPLITFLGKNYIFTGTTHEPTLHIFASPEVPQALRDSIIFIQLHNSKLPVQNDTKIHVHPDELAKLNNFVLLRLEDHLIFSYKYQEKLDLFWWSQENAPSQGTIGMRWLKENGEPDGDWTFVLVDWLPGFSSKSSHDLIKDNISDLQLELCILENVSTPGAVKCQGERVVLNFAE